MLFFQAPFVISKELNLNLEALPEAILETLNTLNSSQAKPLKILKLSIGKNSINTKVLETVCETLRLQSDLEELVFTCEEHPESSSSDLSMLLLASTQKRKLEIFVKKVLVEDSPTKVLPTSSLKLQELEEFTLKIKYDSSQVAPEEFTCLIDFLRA